MTQKVFYQMKVMKVIKWNGKSILKLKITSK